MTKHNKQLLSLQKFGILLAKIILYITSSIFILSCFGLLASGASMIFAILSFLLATAMLPIVYKKIKDFVMIKNLVKKEGTPFFLKFTFPYFGIALLGYIIFFSIAAVTSTDKNEVTLNATYTIEADDTEKDKIGITLTHKNITEIKINDQVIPLTPSPLSYEYPLSLGENNITIVGSHTSGNKEIKKHIVRFTPEEIAAKKAEAEKKKADELAAKQEEGITEKIKILTDKINEVKKFDSTQYLTDPGSIAIVAALFDGYNNFANSYNSEKDPRIKKLATQLKSELSKLQVREFPKLRKAYGKLMGEALWTSNVEVNVIGKNAATIELVGGVFANNQNKLDTYTTIKDNLKALRFDRANFKWYKYDDEYTYWDINSLGDGVVSDS